MLVLDTLGSADDAMSDPPKPDPFQPKGWFESRTVILNGIFGILAAAYAISQVLMDNPAWLDPRIISAAGVIVAIGNVWLRAGTTRPIAGTRAHKEVERALMDKVI
jgi:hypothetical protein